MYSNTQLVIFDADGTIIDAFHAIEMTFAHHGLEIGPLARFQKRHHLFKYLGGIKELPRNLRSQFGRWHKNKLITTLTEIYREEAMIFTGLDHLICDLIHCDGLRIGFVTRNITHEPLTTLSYLFKRHNIDIEQLDFFLHLPLKNNKLDYFRQLREQFVINPAWGYACGDEAKDYHAAIGIGLHPLMVSYGFESFDRLQSKHHIPAEVISKTPDELKQRILHTLRLTTAE
jgi:phosphoglycolate phosphatase